MGPFKVMTNSSKYSQRGSSSDVWACVSLCMYVCVCPFSTSYLTHLLTYKGKAGRSWSWTKMKLRFWFRQGNEKKGEWNQSGHMKWRDFNDLLV